MLNQRRTPCSTLADLFALLEPRSHRTTMAGKDLSVHQLIQTPIQGKPRSKQHQVVPSFVHLSSRGRKSMSCFGNLFHQTTTLTSYIGCIYNFFCLTAVSCLAAARARLFPKKQNSFRQDSESLPGSTEESTEGKTGGKFTHRVGLEPILKKQPINWDSRRQCSTCKLTQA